MVLKEQMIHAIHFKLLGVGGENEFGVTSHRGGYIVKGDMG